MSMDRAGPRAGGGAPLASGPIFTPLRYLGRVTALPVRLIFAAWSRSPMMTTLIGGLVLFVPVVFIAPGGVSAVAIIAAVFTGVLIVAAYLAAMRGGARPQLVAGIVAVGALALDWIAFDWFWAIALVLVAASAGVGIADHVGRARPQDGSPGVRASPENGSRDTPA